MITNLEAVDISGNEIGLEGVLALAKSHLQELNIVGPLIGDRLLHWQLILFLLNYAAACFHLTDTGAEPLFLMTCFTRDKGVIALS